MGKSADDTAKDITDALNKAGVKAYVETPKRSQPKTITEQFSEIIDRYPERIPPGERFDNQTPTRTPGKLRYASSEVRALVKEAKQDPGANALLHRAKDLGIPIGSIPSGYTVEGLTIGPPRLPPGSGVALVSAPGAGDSTSILRHEVAHSIGAKSENLAEFLANGAGLEFPPEYIQRFYPEEYQWRPGDVPKLTQYSRALLGRHAKRVPALRDAPPDKGR